MSSDDRHLDLGAYVLGALSDEDAGRFEEHLAGCERCAEELDRLMGVEALLAEFAADTPPGQNAGAFLAPPAPQLLDRLMEEVRVKRQVSRRRRAYLVAASLAMIVAGPTVTAVVTSQETTASPPAVSQTVTAQNRLSGAHATVAMTDKSWGTQVGLTLDGVKGPLECDLVAVSKSGVHQTVSSWAVPAGGYESSGHDNDKKLVVQGGTSIPRNEIDHFVVRTLDGQMLVTVKA